MKNTWICFGLATSLGLATGCAPEDMKPDVDDVKVDYGKGDAWDSANNPSLFSNDLEFRVDQLPQEGEAANTPWAANYWPIYQDNINYKWAGPNSQSASSKYGEAFGVSGVEDAVSSIYGIDRYKGQSTECTVTSECDSDLAESCAIRDGEDKGVCIPTWFGICHAWAPLAILHPEPLHEVTHNGVNFKINDLKALFTLVHNRTRTRFVSMRCNLDENKNEIAYDAYGRPTDANKECRDMNPGSFHVLMANYLGINRESFVYERTFDYQIWNQPLRGYQITRMDAVTPIEANTLVGATGVGGDVTEAEGNVLQAAWVHQDAIEVTAGDTFKVVMTGTGDADLYVRFGSQPTASSYDCRPYDNGSAENCELTVPSGATQAFVSVNGYAADSDFALTITAGGSTPKDYLFNSQAAELFFVKMTVDYIAESAAETDGNLASTIDRYTHQDYYEYILEVDANGKIFGGEWIGASKRAHPDFAWLPLGHRDSSVANGKITYARVKMLWDMSMTGGGGNTGEVRIVDENDVLAQNEWNQYGPFDLAAGKTFTAILSGTGDADLYIRKGAAPTAASYDCRPYRNGSNEQCTVVGPAKVYVAVHGYATTSDFDLHMEYTEGSGGGGPIDPPDQVIHIDEQSSVSQGGSKFYELQVIAGQRVVIKTQSTKDMDLYLQMSQRPTTGAYLMRAWTTSGNETLSYTPTTSGTLHILVYGYQSGSFRLVTSD